jgi:hypothetical protein
MTCCVNHAVLAAIGSGCRFNQDTMLKDGTLYAIGIARVVAWLIPGTTAEDVNRVTMQLEAVGMIKWRGGWRLAKGQDL